MEINKKKPKVTLKLFVPSHEVESYILNKISESNEIEEHNKKIYKKSFMLNKKKGKPIIIKFRNCKHLVTPITYLKFLNYGRNHPRVIEIIGKTNDNLEINYHISDEPQKKSKHFYLGNTPIYYYTKFKPKI